MDETIRRRACEALDLLPDRTFPVAVRMLGEEHCMLLDPMRRRCGKTWTLVLYIASILKRDETAHVHVLCQSYRLSSTLYARLNQIMGAPCGRVQMDTHVYAMQPMTNTTYLVAEISHLSCLNDLHFSDYKQVRIVASTPLCADAVSFQYASVTPMVVLYAIPSLYTYTMPLPLSPITLAVEALAEMFTKCNAETHIITNADSDGFMQALREHPDASAMHEHVLTMTENIGGLCQFGLDPSLAHSIAMAARLGGDKWLAQVSPETIGSDMQLLYEYTTRIKPVSDHWYMYALSNAIAANDVPFARMVTDLCRDVLLDEHVAYARALQRRAILDDFLHCKMRVM